MFDSLVEYSGLSSKTLVFYFYVITLSIKYFLKSSLYSYVSSSWSTDSGCFSDLFVRKGLSEWSMERPRYIFSVFMILGLAWSVLCDKSLDSCYPLESCILLSRLVVETEASAVLPDALCDFNGVNLPCLLAGIIGSNIFLSILFFGYFIACRLLYRFSCFYWISMSRPYNFLSDVDCVL